MRKENTYAQCGKIVKSTNLYLQLPFHSSKKRKEELIYVKMNYNECVQH